MGLFQSRPVLSKPSNVSCTPTLPKPSGVSCTLSVSCVQKQLPTPPKPEPTLEEFKNQMSS